MSIERYDPEIAGFIERQNRSAEKPPLPTKDTAPQVLVEIALNAGEIVGEWSMVEIYEAENGDEEREKFLSAFRAGTIYNPSFKYPRAEELLHELTDENSKERLEELLSQVLTFGPNSRGDLYTQQALVFVLRDKIATCDIIAGIANKDDETTAKGMQQKYPPTDPRLIESAITTYNSFFSPEETREEDKYVEPLLDPDEQKWLKNYVVKTDEELKSAFEYVLSSYGLLSTQSPEGYEVVFDPKAKSIDVRDNAKGGKILVIPEGRTSDTSRPINGDKLLALLAHEIESHARQSAIGERLFLIGGGKLKIDDETRYEGLAMRNENKMLEQLFGKKTEPRDPYYTFAIAKAETGSSFYEIFAEQYFLRLHDKLKISNWENLPGTIDPDVIDFAEKRAWLTTLRVMRGHTDTTNKQSFAMAKDLAYARGEEFDESLVQIHLGHLNEMGVQAPGSLRLLAGFTISEDSIPEDLRFKNATFQYWEEVLKPKMQAEQAQIIPNN